MIGCFANSGPYYNLKLLVLQVNKNMTLKWATWLKYGQLTPGIDCSCNLKGK